MYISSVTLPKMRLINEDPTDMPATKMKPVYRFNHEMEINRARCNPSDASYIATRTDEGPVTLFQEGN